MVEIPSGEGEILGTNNFIYLWRGWRIRFFFSNLSCVWYGIVSAGRFIEAAGAPFRTNFCRLMGKGNSIRFWLDTWVGNTPLASRVARLYALELSKHCLIKERITSSTQFRFQLGMTALPQRP